MDYNRVQSYIKSHVLPKLDSLPDDVASVKQAFDTWKADWTQARAIKLDNLDAKVSTRATAADMSTALERVGALQTKLQQATEQIKSKVEESASHIAVEKTLPYPRTVVSVRCELGGKKTCVNIKGRGYLNYALMNISGDASKGTIYINIDGRAFIMRSDTNKCAVGLLDENEIIGFGSQNTLTNLVALKDFNSQRIPSEQSVSLNRVDFINGKDYQYINNPIFCNGKIPFNTSLEVLGEPMGRYAQTCQVSYELY